MLFIQFSDNWADEIDVEGCALMTQNEYNKFIIAAKKAFANEINIDFAIGSNEYISYQSFKDFEETLKITEVTNEEVKILEKFHFDNYGHFPIYLFEEYYEEEEN